MSDVASQDRTGKSNASERTPTITPEQRAFEDSLMEPERTPLSERIRECAKDAEKDFEFTVCHGVLHLWADEVAALEQERDGLAKLYDMAETAAQGRAVFLREANAEVERLRDAVRLCDYCDGTGQVEGYGMPEPCDLCDGTGIVVDYAKALRALSTEGEK